jgi:hypothetical protein
MKKITVVISVIMLIVNLLSAQEKAMDWTKETDKAEWKERDSQGEVVFKNQLWILGGWFNSYYW